MLTTDGDELLKRQEAKKAEGHVADIIADRPLDAGHIAVILNWIPKLEVLPLECDGMTRCISALLADANIEHMVHYGLLSAEGKKPIIHYWIELASGELVDLRARMWMGDTPDVPFGVFTLPSGVKYKTQERLFPHQFAASDWLFVVLAGQSIAGLKG